jgi:hypothetical protein
MEKIQKAANETKIAEYFKNCHPYFTLRLLTAVDAGRDQLCLFLGVSSVNRRAGACRKPISHERTQMNTD